MATYIEKPFAHHLVLRLKNDRVIAPGLEERRQLARIVLEQGTGQALMAFGLPDNHLHLEVVAERGPALQLARRVGITVTKRLGLRTGFATAHPEPVFTMRHLRRTFRYVLCQGTRHRLENDPDREGTNLPDLLGMRPIGAYTAAVVRCWLPRLRREKLLEWSHAGPLPTPVFSLDHLWEAALAASAGRDLRRTSEETRRIRCALVHLSGAGTPANELARRLGVGVRTVVRLRAGRPDPIWVEAIRRQVVWRARPDRGVLPAGAFVEPMRVQS